MSFEGKLRLGLKASSDLRQTGLVQIGLSRVGAQLPTLSNPDEVLRCLQLPPRAVLPCDDPLFETVLALMLHAAFEALLGRHFDPMYLAESLFYEVARLDRGPRWSTAWVYTKKTNVIKKLCNLMFQMGIHIFVNGLLRNKTRTFCASSGAAFAGRCARDFYKPV